MTDDLSVSEESYVQCVSGGLSYFSGGEMKPKIAFCTGTSAALWVCDDRSKGDILTSFVTPK